MSNLMNLICCFLVSAFLTAVQGGAPSSWVPSTGVECTVNNQTAECTVATTYCGYYEACPRCVCPSGQGKVMNGTAEVCGNLNVALGGACMETAQCKAGECSSAEKCECMGGMKANSDNSACIAPTAAGDSCTAAVGCPAGHYCDSTSSKCTACDATCKTCTGGTTTSCASCDDSKYLMSDNSCAACDASCATCRGPASTDCVSCPSQNYVVEATAGDGYGTCTACDASCTTCRGGANTDCTSCPAGQSVVEATAGDGYGTCTTCDTTCTTCRGTAATDCVTCGSGQYVAEATAGDGYGTCTACDASCTTCQGTTAADCLSCPSGKYLARATAGDAFGTCTAKAAFDGACTDNGASDGDECTDTDPNIACVGGKCTCKADYMWTESGVSITGNSNVKFCKHKDANISVANGQSCALDQNGLKDKWENSAALPAAAELQVCASGFDCVSVANCAGNETGSATWRCRKAQAKTTGDGGDDSGSERMMATIFGVLLISALSAVLL